MQGQENEGILRYLKQAFDAGGHAKGKGWEKGWEISPFEILNPSGPWKEFPSQAVFPWSYFDFGEVNGKAAFHDGDDRAWALVEQFAPILEMYFSAEKISDVLNTAYHGARKVVKISGDLRVTTSTLDADADLSRYNPLTTFICQTSGADTLLVFPEKVAGLDEAKAYALLGKIVALGDVIHFPGPSTEVVQKMALCNNWRRELPLLAYANSPRGRQRLLDVLSHDVLVDVRKRWLQKMKQYAADPKMIALVNKKWK